MPALHELIAARRDVIVQRFVASIRASIAPGIRSTTVLADHIPQFLDALADAMASPPPPPGARATLPAMREPARDHGMQRLAIGFSLDEVVREYNALRHVILELAAEADITITPREYDVFGQAISTGVLAAVVQYTSDRTRELENERRRLHTILAILPVGVTVYDANGAVLDSNEAARAMWGNPPESAALHGWRDGVPIEADEWPLARALRRGETVHDFEVEIEAFDTKARKTLLLSSAPIGDESGARVAAVTVCIDVTERARRMTETTEALRARDEVMNIVSHDLRNPLGAIRLSAQRLLRLAQGEPTVEAQTIVPSVMNITRSSERMERLLADLLDVARIERGRFSIALAPFELAPAVLEATDLVRPLADAKQIVIDTLGVEHLGGSILGDRDRILQVLANLLGNAIKFTPDGGIITVRAEEQEGEIHVVVSDTGPGVPESLRPKIWDRFFTTQSERRLGTGLGLAIVKGIVEEHGGRVWLDCSAGLGASFHFTLPRVARKRASQPA